MAMGKQVRDWLYVEDHCRAIRAVLGKGRAGEVYNVGGNCSLPNLEVVQRILQATGKPASLITRVTDRPGHDRRYALTNAKLTAETGWHRKWISREACSQRLSCTFSTKLGLNASKAASTGDFTSSTIRSGPCRLPTVSI